MCARERVSPLSHSLPLPLSLLLSLSIDQSTDPSIHPSIGLSINLFISTYSSFLSPSFSGNLSLSLCSPPPPLPPLLLSLCLRQTARRARTRPPTRPPAHIEMHTYTHSDTRACNHTDRYTPQRTHMRAGRPVRRNAGPSVRVIPIRTLATTQADTRRGGRGGKGTIQAESWGGGGDYTGRYTLKTQHIRLGDAGSINHAHIHTHACNHTGRYTPQRTRRRPAHPNAAHAATSSCAGGRVHEGGGVCTFLQVCVCVCAF